MMIILMKFIINPL